MYTPICIHTHIHTVDIQLKPPITQVASGHILHISFMNNAPDISSPLSACMHVYCIICICTYVYMMSASRSTITPTKHSLIDTRHDGDRAYVRATKIQKVWSKFGTQEGRRVNATTVVMYCLLLEHYNKLYCTIYYLLHDCALQQYGSITLYQWNQCIAYCIMNSSCTNKPHIYCIYIYICLSLIPALIGLKYV